MSSLIVSMKNEKLKNWLGEPMVFTTLLPDGTQQSEEADLASVIKSFLRQRDPMTQHSPVVKSLEDAERVRIIGMALQEQTDGVLKLPFGEHKWLMAKVKEVGYRFMPNDVTIFIEALEHGQNSNV